MNIFLFDFDLHKNAEFFKNKDPKRFNKQIVESTQLFAASCKHYYDIDVLKADGTPYTVNRILHHPACKYLLEDIQNHYWHMCYLESLLQYKPDHACGQSFKGALKSITTKYGNFTFCQAPKRYIRITNSDMTGIPEDAPVTEFYKRHLQNKHKEKI